MLPAYVELVNISDFDEKEKEYERINVYAERKDPFGNTYANIRAEIGDGVILGMSSAESTENEKVVAEVNPLFFKEEVGEQY